MHPLRWPIVVFCLGSWMVAGCDADDKSTLGASTGDTALDDAEDTTETAGSAGNGTGDDGADDSAEDGDDTGGESPGDPGGDDSGGSGDDDSGGDTGDDGSPPLGATSGGSGGSDHPTSPTLSASGSAYHLLAPRGVSSASGVCFLIVYSATEGASQMMSNMRRR